MFDLDGKNALVTGASGGIGRAIAETLHLSGATVTISGTRMEPLEELANVLGKRVHILSCDLSNGAEVENLSGSALEKMGSIDILVNNAGVAWGAPIEDFPEVGWDKVMDTNVKGVFFLTQKLLPLLEKNANSETPTHVINVGSIDGIKTPVFDNFSYGPSKAAVHHLTRVLAAHLIKRNIIVNGIAPGPFPTSMLSTGVGGGGDTENTDWDAVGKGNPRGRVGTAEDIAGLAIFLSSRACGFTVGDVITCDGGSVVS